MEVIVSINIHRNPIFNGVVKKYHREELFYLLRNIFLQ